MHDFWTDEHPICGSELNLPIEAIQAKTNAEFRVYAESVRRVLGEALAKHGIPPHNGTHIDAIERDMRLHASRSNVRLIPELGSSEANVIDAGGQVRQEVRQLHAALSVLRKLARTAEQPGRLLLDEGEAHVLGHRLGQGLAVQIVELLGFGGIADIL